MPNLENNNLVHEAIICREQRSNLSSFEQGEGLLEQNKPLEALEHFMQVAPDSPDYYDAMMNCGTISKTNGLYNEPMRSISKIKSTSVLLNIR